MKYCIFLLLAFLCFSQTILSQEYIGDSPSQLKKKLGKNISKTNVSASFEETDQSIILKLDDPKYRKADFVFYMNNNKCVEEVKIACDSCVKKYLKKALHEVFYGWRKINEDTYLSGYGKRLLMTIKRQDSVSILSIKKMDWTRAAYNAIVKTAQN